MHLEYDVPSIVVLLLDIEAVYLASANTSKLSIIVAFLMVPMLFQASSLNIQTFEVTVVSVGFSETVKV